MNSFLLGSNWKMHKTLAESALYLKELVQLTASFPSFSYFAIPPATHLFQAKQLLEGSAVSYGAQNMHWETEGPFTGELSPLWLQELGASIALLGHSERRQYYAENDADLNRKVHTALAHQLTPLLCVGEQAADKAFQVTKETLLKQLRIGLYGVQAGDADQLWIAYEPTWAIGAQGVPAEPAYVAEVHHLLRQGLLDLFGEAGGRVRILYGGSVNPENCCSLAAQPEVDGLFIGRSAWDLTQFRQIIGDLHQQLGGQRNA